MSRATSRSSWLRNPILIVLPLCLAMGGFATARYVQTEPHRRLAQNLDLIEKFDRYKMINLDLTYLMRLNQRQLFSDNELFVEELDDLRQVVGGIEKEPNEKRETVGDPKEYLASLGQAEIQRLRVNYDHFTKLNSEELTRMTNFHQQLQSHPDRVPLMKVLDAYYKWLILLGSTEKANLLDLEPEKRLPEIARIRYQQSKTALGRLGATKLPLDRDEEHLLNWFDLTIRSHEPLIRRQFPGILNAYQSQNETTAEVPQEQLARFAEEASIKQLVAILIRIDREYIEDLIHQDIDLLRRGMSYEAQVIIADQAPADQKELVMNWIEAANQAKATIPEEKLQEFYEQLPAEKRDQLDRMSLEEWTSTLSRMYRERNVLFRIEDLEELFLRGS